MKLHHTSVRRFVTAVLLLLFVVAIAAGDLAQVQAREPAGNLGPGGLAQIGGFIFVDINGDGIQDGGEKTGIANVPVFLTNLEMGEVISVFSSPTGYYMASVLPGTWEVYVPENLPGRRRSTAPITVVVEPGDQINDVNFGYVAPTDVTVASFTVERRFGVNRVQWGTVMEARLDGFRVWRAVDGEFIYTPISGIIPAANSPTGAEYTWLDTNVEEGVAYWYMIQSLPDEQMFGPVYADAQGQGATDTQRLFIPFFIR